MITDRTQKDALSGSGKGIYGYTDLNRVEAAVKKIADQFPALGIGKALETKTDWGLPGDFSVSSWPVASQMDRYLGNVIYIRDLLRIDTVLPASMNRLTCQGANNIEKVLETALARVEGIRAGYHYSGEMFAGEEYL